jgi:2-iminobutanoate/2-iminopropanoate deaminase
MRTQVSHSSKREVLHPDKKVPTGAYSAGIIRDGWLFISGQGPLDLATGNAVEGNIEEQTRLTLSHVGKILEAANCTFDDVVKCTCYISDIRDFDRFDHTYSEYFPGVRPARTTVQAVLSKGLRVEIDAIARAGNT